MEKYVDVLFDTETCGNGKFVDGKYVNVTFDTETCVCRKCVEKKVLM